MEFSIKNFFSECEQIHSFLQICSHWLQKSFIENLCSVTADQLPINKFAM